MWVNLHDLPVGKSMYTVGFTEAPVDLPKDERYFDEDDIVLPSRSTVSEVLAAVRAKWAEQDLYAEDLRFVGVINQSDGYVMQENWEGVRGVIEHEVDYDKVDTAVNGVWQSLTDNALQSLSLQNFYDMVEDLELNVTEAMEAWYMFCERRAEVFSK